MHLLRSAILLSGLAAGAVLADGATLRLHVSATVPPRPCEYPDVCPGMASSTISTSQATVVGGRVLYLGPRPDVTRHGDLLTVRF